MKMFKVYGIHSDNGLKEGHIFIAGESKKEVIKLIGDYGLIAIDTKKKIEMFHRYENRNKVKKVSVW
jgi:hypothetical protein